MTADECNQEPVQKCSLKPGEVLCKHKDKDFEHFAHGLCEKCYNKVITSTMCIGIDLQTSFAFDTLSDCPVH